MSVPLFPVQSGLHLPSRSIWQAPHYQRETNGACNAFRRAVVNHNYEKKMTKTGEQTMLLRSVALLCAMAIPAAAKTSIVEVSWDQLSGLILGKTITIALPEGAVVQGETLSVTSSSLMLDVKKTSDPAQYPAGPISLPRPSISELRMVVAQGNGGRVLGSALALAGMVAGRALHGKGLIVPTFTRVAVATTVGGYESGKSMDQDVRLIRIEHQ
jgi:hypothetical protein